MAALEELATWWGRHRLLPDRFDVWMIGSLDLAIERTASAWTMRWRYVDRHQGTSQAANEGFRPRRLSQMTLREFEAWKSPAGQAHPVSSLSPYYPAEFETLTLPVANPNEDLIFSPCLPDDSLSIALGGVVMLEPADRLQLGAWLPLSIKIEVAASHGALREACEVPIERLCETWIGASPVSGEVALTAERPQIMSDWTQHRPRLDAAAIAITVKNIGASATLMNRMAIPCPRLGLYHSPQTGFWSDSLTLEGRDDENGTSWFQRTDKSLPKEAGQAQLVAHPRRQPHEAPALSKLKELRSSVGGSISGFFKDKG